MSILTCNRLWNEIRLLPRKLSRHKVVTAIRILVGSVTFATMILASYYGFTAWLHQRRAVSESNVRRIEASFIELNDLSQRWTEPRIAETIARKEIDFAYPHVELSVQISLDGTRHDYASFKGVVGREPELTGQSLAWGECVSRHGPPGVVISRALYQRLGGQLTPTGPNPRSATLTITRTLHGQIDSQRVEVDIVGILRRDDFKLFGPLAVAIDFDRWQTHKADQPLGPSDPMAANMDYDHVDGYVPTSQLGQVPQEESNFGIRATRQGEVEWSEAEEDIWATFVTAGLAPVTEEEINASLPNNQFELWPVWMSMNHNIPNVGIIAGLSHNDPRWKRGGITPVVGEVWTKNHIQHLRDLDANVKISHRSLSNRLTGLPECDAVTTHETLLRLQDHRTRQRSGLRPRIEISDRLMEDPIDRWSRYPNHQAVGSPSGLRLLPSFSRRDLESVLEWTALADHHRSGLSHTSSRVTTTRFHNPVSYRQADQHLRAATPFRLTPLTDLRPVRLVKHVIHRVAADSATIPLSDDMARQLVMAQPTFRVIIPRITLSCQIDGYETTICSHSGDADPIWCEHLPIVRNDIGSATPGIYLSQSMARRICPSSQPGNLLGRAIDVTLWQGDRDQGAHIRIPVTVVGVTDSGDCYASLDDMKQWKLWTTRRLVFDTATHTFQVPSEVYDRQGYISAVFYASSEQAVEPLVAYLKSMGCEVRHQLEEQRQLVQLAMAVAILVILFVSGSVTNACFNSGAVSWMDLTTRSKEIGIKMAHGLTRGDIILANLAEGGLVGVISCVFGVLVVWWSHPMLRRLIQQTMGFGDEFYLIGVIAMATAWLYACAAAVVIGFNVLGAFVPTCLALRKAPVELLRE